jgi:hypothetical protein
MGQVQNNPHLFDDDGGADRRRSDVLGRAQQVLNAVIHSKWVAMFAVAFAVSWAFHQVDEIGQHRLETQQRIMQCTLEGIAAAQVGLQPGNRVPVAPILERCEKQHGNKR